MLKFKISIKDGKVELNKEQFNRWMNQQPDGDYNLHVTKYRKTRSDRQRRYYFGVIIPIYAEACGGSPEETHDHLGYTFLRTSYECPISGELISKTKSTTKLNTKEMEEYMEQCRRECLETYNVNIPLPRETEFNY